MFSVHLITVFHLPMQNIHVYTKNVVKRGKGYEWQNVT